jgi:hypothetical protein
MNKKIVLLPLVACSLVLAGCVTTTKTSSSNSATTGDGSSSSSDSSSSSGSASTSSDTKAEKTPAEKLADFLKSLNDVNCTFKFSNSSNDAFTTFFYSSYGFYTINGETKNGVLANGQQGLFDFSYDANGDVVVGQAESKSTAVTVDYYTPDLIANAADYFEYSGSGLSFSLKKDEAGTFDTIGIADNLIGMIDYAADDKNSLTSITLDLAESLEEGTFTYKFGTETATLKICDIGTTSNSKFDAYMKNPKTLVAPTDFTANFKAVAAKLFGTKAVIPFPADATVLFREDLTYDSNNNVYGVSFDEYSGDITANYATALETAGYVLDANGETYQLRTVEASEKSDGTFVSAALSYDDTNEYTEVKFTLNVAPKTYEGTDFTTINSLLMVFNRKNLVNVPLLTASTDVTKTITADSALANGGLLNAEVTASIADEAKADAYALAYFESLKTAVFTASTIVTWENDAVAVYTRGDATVMVSKTYDENYAYSGNLVFNFSYGE